MRGEVEGARVGREKCGEAAIRETGGESPSLTGPVPWSSKHSPPHVSIKNGKATASIITVTCTAPYISVCVSVYNEWYTDRCTTVAAYADNSSLWAVLCWTVNACLAGWLSGRAGAPLGILSQHLRALHEAFPARGVGREGSVREAVNVSVGGLHP